MLMSHLRRLSMLLILAPVAVVAEDRLPALVFDESVDGTIDDAAPVVATELLAESSGAPTVGRSFSIEVDVEGPVTFELRSYFFDAYLVLRDEGGRVIAEDDDGWIGTHARVVANLDAGTYRIDACARRGERGTFELVARRGEPEPLSDSERDSLAREDAARRVEELEAVEGPASLVVADALHELGLLLVRQEPGRARAAFERSLGIREAVLGSEHLDVATSLEYVGASCWLLGEIATARTWLERRLEIHEAVFGPDHLEVASSLSEVAAMCEDLGETDAAIPLHARALAIRESALGPEHPKTTQNLLVLAKLHFELEDFEAARPLYERCLAIREATLDPEHEDIATVLGNLSATLFHLGDYAAARPIATRALAIREAVLGADHPEVAGVAYTLGVVLRELREFDAARVQLDRVVRIRETSLGPDHLDVAASLYSLGRLHEDMRDYAAARPLLERSLAIREAALGRDHELAVSTAVRLGVVLRKLREFGAARPHLERGLAIAESMHGADHETVAGRLVSLANLERDIGEFAQAQSMYERALAILEELHGPEHPEFTEPLIGFAQLLRIRGDYDGARSQLERSLANDEATLGPEHPDIHLTLNQLASLHLALGEFGEARRLYERALSILEGAYGPEDALVSLVLGNLAGVLSDAGDYAAARPYSERVLAIREKEYGPAHPLVATALGNLGDLLRLLGDGAGARVHIERAQVIRQAVLGPDHPDTAVGLNALARLHHEAGELSAARPLFERALSIRETLYGTEHPLVSATLHSLGRLLRDLGEPDAARPFIERSLAIREASLGPAHLYVSDNLRTLALLAEDAGDREEARTFYERALRIRETVWGRGHWEVAEVLGELARICLDAGEPEEAFAYARRLEWRRDQLRQTLASLTGGESYRYLSRQRSHRDVLLASAAAIGDHDSAYAAVLADKGQVARLTMQTGAQLRGSLDPEAAELSAKLSAIQARLSRLALAADVRDPKEHAAELDALRETRDAMERELRRLAVVGEEVAVTPGDIAAALPPRSAVVDLLVHPSWIPASSIPVEGAGNAPAPRGEWTAPRVSAWVLRADDARVRFVDLGPSAAIEAATAAFLSDLVARRGMPAAAVAEAEDHNDTLRAQMWDPLVPHLEAVETVFVSPDGALGTLPWETLQDESGRFLIEQYAFVYPPEIASMVSRPAKVTPFSDRSASLLAIGGVDFRRRADRPGEDPMGGTEERADSRGGFNAYWGRLPATEYESQVVTDMHADATEDQGRSLLLQGADATEERLKAEMPRHAILHLATHGFFQPEGLPSMWDASLDVATRLTGLHPGLLSGLVLAGVNRPLDAEDDRDDGYLTASEVTLLHLDDVELVVLSACETGLGRPQSGEGLAGLRRAFDMAGADTVISSLWSVKDESTSVLMQSFYANLFFKGMGRHEALRAAQLEMLNKNRRRHGDGMPSTWGAFVLSGEWR